MLRRCLLAAALLLLPLGAPLDGSDGSTDLECAWRRLAVEFATGLLGPHVAEPVQAALAGSISGDLPTPVHCEYPPAAPAPLQREGGAAPWLSAARVLHVAPHPAAGGDGTAAKPLSLLAAQAVVRAVPPSARSGGTTVLLAGGTYRL